MMSIRVFRVIVVLAVLISGLLIGLVSVQANLPPDSAPISTSKITSLLCMHIKIKQEQAKISPQCTIKPFGIDSQSSEEVTSVNLERVFLHFAQPPSASQIAELNSLGVTVYPGSWLPPVNNFQTGFVLADMPIDKLDSLTAKSYIVSLDTAEQSLSPQNDQARAAMNVDPVWNGGNTGAGVTVAVLDSGIDTSNPDFPHLDSTNSKDYSNYPTLDNTIANTVTGHGSHVTASLLGRGVNSITYKGVAPGANLVFLKIGNDTDGQASSSAVIYALKDAVDIYHVKVINLSYGGWSEYHDGSDQTCQAVDYATTRGATVFVAAGNEGSLGWHYSSIVNANSTTTDIPIIVYSGSSYLPLNVVSSIGTDNHINFSLQYYDSSHKPIGALTSGPSVSPRLTQSNLFQLFSPVGPGIYYLKIHSDFGFNLLFHIYNIGGSTAIQFSNSNSNYTIDTPAESDSAVAVGAYVTRNSWTNYKSINVTLNPPESEGSIASFSSRGPRVDGWTPVKPDIVAPGATIISVRDTLYTPGDSKYDPYIIDNDGLNLNGSGPANYIVDEGTSMASPMAAGVAALILSRNPTYTPEQIKSALETTAADKGNTGFDNIYGFGLIDASRATKPLPLSTGKIVFASGIGDSEVYVMNSDGTNRINLTNSPWPDLQPSWSPDGSKIAFVSSRTGVSCIFIMNADGTNPVRLTTGWDVFPDWSPDGTKIVFCSARDGYGEIYVMNNDGSNQTRLTKSSSGGNNPSWSPDGTRIAFQSYRSNGTAQIYTMNLDGTNQTNISHSDILSSDEYPHWSGDGRKIVFSSSRDSDWGSFNQEIYSMNADGSGQTRLTNNPAYDIYPNWSPDSTQIIFSSSRSQSWGVYTINANGSVPINLTNVRVDDLQPDWFAPQSFPSKMEFSVSPGENKTGFVFRSPPVVQIQDASGNIVTDYNSSVTINISAGTGKAGAVLSGAKTVNAVNGVATLSGLSINLAGRNYMLTATSGNFTAASSPFNILNPGDANGDGVINMADVTRVEREVLGLESLSTAADANNDGKVNMADVVKIERIILGLDP